MSGAMPLPTTLRIAIGFVAALWIVGLTALACGAPGEIVLVTAALGTVAAVIEARTHRVHGIGDSCIPTPDVPAARSARSPDKAGQEPAFRRKH